MIRKLLCSTPWFLPRPSNSATRSANNLKRRRLLEKLESRQLLAGDATITVDTLEDTVADDGLTSLREAIAVSNETTDQSEKIRFARRLRGTIQLDPSLGELVISDDVIIHGPGANRLTISGANDEGTPTTRVFRVDPAPEQGFGPPVDEAGNPLTIDVQIRRLSISEGLATDAPGFPPEDPFGFVGFAFGGGLYNRGSNVILNAVSMSNNRAGDATTALAAGGAIANEFGGTMTIRHSSFDDNDSVGAIIGVGGAISQDVGPTADGLGTVPPTSRISHSSFTNNTATALFTDPVLAGPFAPFAGFALGGAILNIAGTLSVGHSSFSDNQANSGDGINGNSAGAAVGGAIFSDDFAPFIVPEAAAGQELPPGRNSFLDLHHSHFDGNSANGGTGDGAGDGGSANGGAVGVSIAFFPESARIRHNHFRNNHAVGGTGGDSGGTGGRGVGGALAVLAGADVSASANGFTGNKALGGAGGVGGDGGNGRGGAVGLASLITSDGSTTFDPLLPAIDISRGWFRGNVAQGGNGGEEGSGGDGIGGAVGSSDNASAEIDRSLFRSNRAVGGEAGEQGVNASMFSTTIVADYQFIVIPGGPLAESGFPVDTPIPVQAKGELTFKLDPTSLNDPAATSIPFIDVSGRLEGQVPDALKPFTLGPFEFNSGSLENVVRDDEGRITSADVEGLSMEWEQIAPELGLRVFNVDPIPFGGPITGVPFPDGTVLGGAELFDIALDTGGGTSVIAARGQNRTLTAEGDASVVASLGGGGIGGAVANLGGGTMAVHSSWIYGNRAKGRDGGNGEGGGIYNGVDSALESTRTWIVRNRAQAVEGLGRGGGIFNAGDLDLDRFTRVFANDASDEGDDFFDLALISDTLAV